MTEDPAAPPITRRQVVGLTVATASLAAGRLLWRRSHTKDHLKPLEIGAPLVQPRVVDSRDGRLQVTLVASTGVRIAGHDTRAYGYNGTSPGPTLRVRPGDELAVRLVNRLDHATNLHTHGLRVSPAADGDNPFVDVAPGESFDYRIRVPRDHPHGTHWYHPHHHGTAADQIFGGLAGALLVVPHDRPSDIEVAADRVLLIGDTTLDSDGSPVHPSADARAVGREGEMLLVNGQSQPTIAAEQGTWQRWRLINACTSRVLDVGLAGHPFIQIAIDGNLFPTPVEREWIRLSPGNRADVLVRPSGAGRTPLRARGAPRGSFGAHKPSTATSDLAVLDVAATQRADAPQPSVPVPGRRPVATSTRRRVLTLTMARGTTRMAFGIDDKVYDPDRLDQDVKAGSTEEWQLNNAGPLAHPFHLHAWPFEVLETSEGQTPTGTVQDVVLVPPWGWARIRVTFNSPVGRGVYHCHVVDHSDAGMMGTIRVA